jgi:hypothetical protein
MLDLLPDYSTQQRLVVDEGKDDVAEEKAAPNAANQHSRQLADG